MGNRCYATLNATKYLKQLPCLNMPCHFDEGLMYKAGRCFGCLNNINIFWELYEQVIMVNWLYSTVTK